MKRDGSKPGVRAVRAFQKSERWLHKKAIDPVIDPVWNRRQASNAATEAEALMRPPERLLRGGNEVIRDVEPDEVLAGSRNAMVCTLEDRHRARLTSAAFAAPDGSTSFPGHPVGGAVAPSDSTGCPCAEPHRHASAIDAC
jgi:hypothetical protein